MKGRFFMNGIMLVGSAIIIFFLAYRLYGRWLLKTWGFDPNAKTPAYKYEDGQDFTPASKFTVFSHQFTSITGAGPVTGPIIAAMYGWLPAFLWIIFGGIFFGAVQDFTALYASVKNQGKSMGMLIEQYIGKTGRRLFLLFCWLFSLLVIAAFGDIVANNAFKRNEDGRLLIDNNGVPVKETDKVIGNITPDWTGSVGTTLRWKGISLYALFDIRCGGDFISLTDSYACAYGNSARTLEGRDGMVIDGIVESTGMPNEKSVTAESYWTSIGGASGVAEAFMYDGSYVKLRELSLGWSLPQKWLRNTPLKSVKISAVGRDLWFLFKNAPVNPESAYSRSDFAQAFEIGSLPPTRTMGFSLNVKF